MNGIRYWLADLISGGELTRLNEFAEKANRLYFEAGKNLMINSLDVRGCNLALYRIAAEVKPTSNATVKRIGRIAQEALK